MTSTVPESAHSGLLGKSMNMMVSAPVPSGRAREDLMTRRPVASLFRVTAAVASWARRGRLPEVRDEAGKPRYRRTDVETLFRSGAKRRTR